LIQPSQFTRLRIFALVVVIFLLVVWVGVVVSRQITHPLQRVVRASTRVARGDLDLQIEQKGNDEVAVLAHAFNAMVDSLREGSVYRDLLGRTVSPEVREQLRQAFASGDLRLDGQNALATVLMTDIRGFTTLSEKANPTTVLSWLNEYFAELIPLIAAHGGVVNKFEGDAMMVFFGILPQPLTTEESSYMACQTAVAMLSVIEQFNERRRRQGEPIFVTGIGIHTGMVTAGSLGAADRLHYTIIGDTVNTTQRLESFTRNFDESAAVISRQAMVALGKYRQEFWFEPQGAHFFKGKSEAVEIFRLGVAHQTMPSSYREVAG
jgi:adenylate cyclase